MSYLSARVSEGKSQLLPTVEEEIGSDRGTLYSHSSDNDFGSRNLRVPGGKRGASKRPKGPSRSSSRYCSLLTNGLADINKYCVSEIRDTPLLS